MERQRKPKSPSKALVVRLGNTVIKEPTATETFVAVIKEIGPSVVANLPESRGVTISCSSQRLPYAIK